MNERIKELAEQCYEDNSTQIDVYKFADLVVRECAEVARLNTRVDSKVYLMIQEHFGVDS